MPSLIMLIVYTALFSVVVLGLGYLAFIKLKPKRMSWKADVYQLGSGVILPEKDKDGKDIISIKLTDLKPYTTDVIEKDEQGKGKTIYRLVKLNKSVPEITGDCVEFWGNDIRKVAVLYQGGNCTLLKKGYDAVTGKVVFQPLPYEVTNAIINEMAIRKDRLHKEKDILQAILPYVAIVAACVALVGISWVLGKTFVEMTDKFKDATEHNDDALVKASENYKIAMGQFGQIQQVTIPLGATSPISTPPISVE